MIKEIIENITEAVPSYTVVTGSGENVETYDTNSPKEAITKWVEGQKKEPMNVYIEAKDKKVAQELYDWANGEFEEFSKIVDKQKSYKPDYLAKAIRTIRNIDTDALHPFTVG